MAGLSSTIKMDLLAVFSLLAACCCVIMFPPTTREFLSFPLHAQDPAVVSEQEKREGKPALACFVDVQVGDTLIIFAVACHKGQVMPEGRCSN
jgi:hypothetical protein